MAGQQPYGMYPQQMGFSSVQSATNSPQLRYSNDPLINYQPLGRQTSAGKQQSPLLTSTAPHFMRQQLPSIEDETACIEDDEGEDIIKSINSLINQGKHLNSLPSQNKLKFRPIELY